MNNEDVNPIVLSSNYSGACEHTPATNADLLKLTSQTGEMIYGPTLFALKYRVLPCTVKRSVQNASGAYDDAYIFNMMGQFLASGRGRQWCPTRKQGGMYHATRLVYSSRTVPNSNHWIYHSLIVLYVFSSVNIKLIQIHFFMNGATTRRINILLCPRYTLIWAIIFQVKRLSYIELNF